MASLLIITICAAWGVVCLAYAPQLYRCWREPLLRHPFLILESDDWGAGPMEQAASLDALRTLLLRFQDTRGAHPVMTLGIILAVADGARMRESSVLSYHATDLTQPEFSGIRQQIIKGAQAGVFALQLHGKEHYWPDSIMLSTTDHRVRAWLVDEDFPRTEALPSHLQSRWTDSSSLPSSPILPEAINAAISEEVHLFEACFGERPRVAVATTFVWDTNVERAWAAQGIDTIITPGVRYTLRDGEGKPGGADKTMSNGARSESGQVYLVRDVYFEPALGHAPSRLIDDASRCTRLGRPTLVEIHRFNFLGEPGLLTASLKTLEAGLTAVLRALPNVRFISSQALAEAIRISEPDIVEHSLLPRIRVWLRRIEALQTFSRYAKLTGLVVVFWLLKKMLRVE